MEGLTKAQKNKDEWFQPEALMRFLNTCNSSTSVKSLMAVHLGARRAWSTGLYTHLAPGR